MALIKAIKSKNKLYYALAAVSGIAYLLIVVFGVNDRGNVEELQATYVAKTIQAADIMATEIERARPTETLTPTPTKTPTLTPTITNTPKPYFTPTPDPNCNPNYSGACLPLYGTFSCKDSGYTNIRVIGVDVFGIDKDGDGWACERN